METWLADFSRPDSDTMLVRVDGAKQKVLGSVLGAAEIARLRESVASGARDFRADAEHAEVHVVFPGDPPQPNLAVVTITSLTTDDLRRVLEGTASQVGADFFRELIRNLVESLDVPMGFICEVVPPDNDAARTLALWSNGGFAENIEYALEETPCENVVGKQFCYHPANVSALFPKDKLLTDIGAEAYMGIPFFSASGAATGHMGIIDTRPRHDEERMKTVLQIFASRAASELERVRTDEEGRRATRELERSHADMQQFVYAASHDLREPLRTVISFIQLIKDDERGRLAEQSIEYITIVIDAAKRMSGLIDDLLVYQRLGIDDWRPESTELSEILRFVLSNLKLMIHDCNGSITVGELDWVMADRTQLTVLLQNLISNGLKFHDERPPHITVNAKRKGDMVEVSVRDNGIGIDPTHGQRIFQVFERLHARDEYPGSGIGLAICKRIVERHGGELWFDAPYETGTVFHFTLPAGTPRI